MTNTIESVAGVEILDQFRERIFDLKQDDDTLLRFLKYNAYNISRSEEMLRKSVKWRQENDVASYLHWKPPKPVADDFKFECIGEDNDGHAVIYLPIGGWSTKKVMEMGYRDDSFQFRFHLFETIMASIEKTRKTKFVMIMDMEGLTYKKCMHYETVQMLSLAFKDFEENFPEKLRACYIINAPWIFTYIYNTMKHFLSSKTLNKAKVFNEDIHKWRPFLLDRFPVNLLNKIWNPMNSTIEINNET